MTNPTAQEVADWYKEISQINPPKSKGTPSGANEFCDLALLRAVDPRQYSYLEKLATKSPPTWGKVYEEVQSQRNLRSKVFEWISEINQQYKQNPSEYTFPDPHTLLFWIWTFQLFITYVTDLDKPWTKYLYRGENKDYGSTSCQPSITRPKHPDSNSKDTPQRLREFLSQYLRDSTASEVNNILWQSNINTLSMNQALAIAQHYSFPTPLLDITINPEVALYFATKNASERQGILAFYTIDSNNSDDYEAFHRIQVISVPPIFKRIHRQSGYFICTKKEANNNFVRLKFMNHINENEVVTFAPTWLMLHGAVQPNEGIDDLILADDLQLEVTLSSRITSQIISEQPFPTYDIRKAKELSDDKVSQFINDVFCGAGRFGINDKGQRFNELIGGLLTGFMRHSPLYFHSNITALVWFYLRNKEPLALYFVETYCKFFREYHIYLQQEIQSIDKAKAKLFVASKCKEFRNSASSSTSIFSGFDKNDVQSLIEKVPDVCLLDWVKPVESANYFQLQFPITTWYDWD